jgi:chromate transporter
VPERVSSAQAGDPVAQAGDVCRPAPGDLPRPVRLISLLSAFGTIGVTSFGGARAAYFRHVLVVSRRWIDDRQFLEALTVSQILPGPNVSNLTVCLGQRLRGLLGATLASLGFLLPGALMILALAMFYFGHGSIPAVSAVFKGVGAAAVGLSAATVWQVGRAGVSGARDLVIIAATFALVALLRVNLLIPLVTIAPLSVWLARPRPAASAEPAGTEQEPGGGG